MNTLLHLGGQIISLQHIIRAEFEDAYPGGEEHYDEDSRTTFITSPRKANLKLTLTSQHMDLHIDDFNSGYYKAAASENDVVRLHGEMAVELWTWLVNESVNRLAEMPETN